MTKPQKRVAYTIPQQVPDHNLNVLYSANAWWMNQVKVHRLLDALKMLSTIHEACTYAGITLPQYKYFARVHPVINELREDYKHILSLRAKQTIFREISSGNGRMAMRS